MLSRGFPDHQTSFEYDAHLAGMAILAQRCSVLIV